MSSEFRCAISPTVLHESYHTLVYSQNWDRSDARRTLGNLVRHPFVEFLNQTKSVSVTARNVAGGYGLGGRDSLILANFLANHIAEVYTHDGELLELRQIEWRGTVTKLTDPVTKSDGI